jgi:flavin-dependent dehydrogenase
MLGRVQLLRALRACATEEGVTFVEADELYRVLPTRQGLQLQFTGPVQELVLDASFAIDASGRAAVLARKLGVGRRTFDHLVAYGVRGPVHGLPEGVVHTFSVADGWVFAVSDSPGQAHVCFYTNGRLAGRVTEAKIMERVPYQIRSLMSDEDMWLASGVSAANASTSLLDVPGGTYWLACGDALQTVDPLSSSGITTALQQGAAAVSAAVASLSGNLEPMRAYWLESRAHFDSYVRNRNSFYGFGESAS